MMERTGEPGALEGLLAPLAMGPWAQVTVPAVVVHPADRFVALAPAGSVAVRVVEVPAVWAGAVAVHEVAVQVTAVAGLPGPKATSVAPVRPVPVPSRRYRFRPRPVRSRG
ncbi:hypothetical protein OG389_32625 [Streptomyces sp. NBC_00435]|uniref:hypothetical protein n=1 Tax=Streptomyces sp. NBC_00435 TaxID=2903649 RepID=UPI002E1ADA62